MPYEVKNLIANVRKQNPRRPAVRSIVLHGMPGDEQPWYLQVRFYDFETLDIEGDHLMFGLQEAMDITRAEYGILETDWVVLRPAQVDAIPTFIAGKRVQRFTFVKAKNQPSSIDEAEEDASFCVDDYRQLAETHFGRVAWDSYGFGIVKVDGLLFELEPRENSLSVGCSGDGDIAESMLRVSDAVASQGIVCFDVQTSQKLEHLPRQFER